MSALTKELKVRITADANGLKGALNGINSDIKKVSKDFEGLKKVGEGISSVGKKLTAGLTLPIVGAGVASAKTAIDMESAFAGVRKTLDTTGQSAEEAEATFKGIEEGIIKLSKKMPTVATEIAGVAESAGQLGIQTENILGFTETMVMLGDTTNLSAEEAATSLARLANITGMSQKDFDKLGSTIVALGNNLATTEGEITEMALRLAGAGSQVGMSEAQILSFAGALSSVGIQAEAGGSAFSKVMIDMQLATETGGDRLNQFAKVAGMSASEFKKAFEEDASSAIISFVKGLGEAENQGKSAIAILDEMEIREVNLRDALLRAAGASDLFSDAIKIGSEAWGENSALTNEAKQRYETLASKLDIAKNNLIAVGNTIGERLTPFLEKLADGISKVCNWFQNLSPTTQTFIMVVAGLMALLGPLLILIGSGISLFANLSIVASALGVTIGALVGGFASVIAPILAVIAAIGAFIAIVVNAYKENETFRKTVDTVFNNIKSIISNVMSVIKDVISMAWSVIKVVWDNGLKQILQFAVTVLATMASNFTSRLNTITSIVKTVVSLIKAIFSGDFSSVSNIVNNILEKVVSAFNNKMESAKSAISKGINTMKNMFNITFPTPKIKLPRISVSGSFSLNPPSVPKFGISWYSKGAIFKRPAVLGGIGVGDAHNGIGSNAEAILPINQLPKLLGLDKLQNNSGIALNIENFNNNTDKDIEYLANELAFYMRRKNIGIGGAF